MFISCHDPRIAYTGRWYMGEKQAITTSTGSYFELGFAGETAVFRFDVHDVTRDVAHLYISVDGSASVESPVVPFLRVKAGAGNHTVRLTLKSLSEFYDRWLTPEAKVGFLGFEAEDILSLPLDTRPIIEFIGDSITEGVETDPTPYAIYDHFCKERVFQDDVTATYGYLTAEMLNMRPVIMGYGAVGVAKGGCGNVPMAKEAYPFCFSGAPVTAYEPSIIVLNHGTNDGGHLDVLGERYKEMLDLLRNTHPHALVVALSPFMGDRDPIIEQAVTEYNQERNADVLYIPTGGLIPRHPIHPSRESHRVIANHLAAILKDKLATL